MKKLKDEMALKDTVGMMTSDNYKERFRGEYAQTLIRYEKLQEMLVKYEAGTLNFEPTCSYEILNEQEAAMQIYLHYLEVRAEIEDIDLTF